VKIQINGLIALAGSGEYLPVMDEVDRYLLNATQRNAPDPNVVCVPTAAGTEGNGSVNYWLELGTAHFEALGANVTPARIVDATSANAPEWLPALENADLIYFSGGKPNYLYETMQNSRAWDAAQKAWARGAAYAGCSAGAMILAQQIPNVRSAIGQTSQNAFGVIPAKFIMPHFDRMKGLWAGFLFGARRQLEAGEFIIGVDEETALVGKLGGEWQIMGKGSVHLIMREGDESFTAGEKNNLKDFINR